MTPTNFINYAGEELIELQFNESAFKPCLELIATKLNEKLGKYQIINSEVKSETQRMISECLRSHGLYSHLDNPVQAKKWIDAYCSDLGISEGKLQNIIESHAKTTDLIASLKEMDIQTYLKRTFDIGSSFQLPSASCGDKVPKVYIPDESEGAWSNAVKLQER